MFLYLKGFIINKLIAFIFLCHLTYAGELISPIPKSITYDKEKASLGKKLFYDKVLSKNEKLSCSSCHLLLSGGDDDRIFHISTTGKEGDINTPTVYNAIYNFRQTWNGRYKNLEEQIWNALENPQEMGDSIGDIVSKLKKARSYHELFIKFYADGLTKENLVNAIGEFVKALTTPSSPFDMFLEGDSEAISKRAKVGYELFKVKGCVVCHNGVNIGGNLYNKFGIYEDLNSSRLGKYEFTKKEEDRLIFKVPSLRNIALTSPYMHDGRIKTLRDAVEFMTEYQLGRYMEAGEIDDIVEFLKTLNGEIPEIALW